MNENYDEETVIRSFSKITAGFHRDTNIVLQNPRDAVQVGSSFLSSGVTRLCIFVPNVTKLLSGNEKEDIWVECILNESYFKPRSTLRPIHASASNLQA